MLSYHDHDPGLMNTRQKKEMSEVRMADAKSEKRETRIAGHNYRALLACLCTSVSCGEKYEKNDEKNTGA